MRLLMVTTSFPPVLGGLQTYAIELAKRFAARCESFAVAAPWARGARAHDRALPFRVHRLPEIGEDLALSGVLPLAVLGRIGRFDAAFATHWAAAHAVIRAGAPRRVFCAAHGKELLLRPLERFPVVQAGYDRVRSTVLARADGFFPVSSYTATLLAGAGVDPARITVVHNGVDAERYYPGGPGTIRSELGIGDRRMLLSVARLVRRKGIDTVIAALPAVRERVPDAVYVVAGDGHDRARLEGLALEHGVADHVRFAGSVPGDLRPWYAACDVFVMPARVEPQDVEGFGLVFLEAGACEKPVVGARCGGAVDAVVEGETGLLVPPDDPGSLAAALVALLIDPARRTRMGRAAREHVLRQGTWDHAATLILSTLGRGKT
jgi:phosphatidylinositol alpha-1,6-mannosyltransferase